jgi:hypothetical protein
MTEDKNVRPMWSEDELDLALATLNAEVPPGDNALAEARATLMSAAGSPAPVKKWHRGRWAAAIAIVAAVVVAALVVPTIRFGDQPAPATATAAVVLNQAADKITTTDPVVNPGQYLYIESHEWHSVTIGDSKPPLIYLEESVTQTWVPADRNQEWVQRSASTGNRKWIQGSDADLRAPGIDTGKHPVEELRAKCGDFYLNPGQQPCLRPASWAQPTPEFLAALPADPKQLYTKIREEEGQGNNNADREVMFFVSHLVRTGLPTAATRANLYRALTFLPKLEVSDQNANLDGRIGVGLGFEHAGRKEELIIDPASGQLIGQRTTTTQTFNGMPAGTVTSYTSVSTGVVDKVGDKPGR